MPYVVPNGPDAPNVDLTEPDAGDYLALGFDRTGVVSGGTVTQSGSPNMTVQVDGAEIVIDGAPIAKTAGPVTLDASTADPRFDIIGWYVTGAPVAIKGSPSNNPVLPVFDPAVFCMTATVYVSSGTVSITTPYITQKQIAPITSLRRHYTADNDIIVESTTPLRPTAFRLLASGAMSWANNTLSNLGDTLMDWFTSLQIRQVGSLEKALILKVFGTGVKGNNIFEVQPSNATTPIAGMDTIGRLFGINFRLGTGSPEGVVLADKGTLYLNEDPTDGNTALWVKLTNAATTGWAALASYVVASQAIPVGGVISWPGIIGTDTIPAGYLYCDGAEEATATYPALSTFCGTKFGTAAAGNFKKPDYRGKTLFGIEGVLATLPGINIGAVENIMSLDQLTTHDHVASNGEHAHPQDGAYVYQVPQAYLPTYHLPLNDGTGVGINLEPLEANHSIATEVVVEPVGNSQPMSMYQPSQSTHFLIKT